MGNSFNKYNIVSLAYRVTENILATKPQLISNGFRKAGLQPWDSSAPNTERMKPSKMYETIPEEPVPVLESLPRDGVDSGMDNSSIKESLEEAGYNNKHQLEHLLNPAKEDIDMFPLNNTGGPVSFKPAMPDDAERFLVGFEHLLSKQELATFEKMYAAGDFSCPNLPYQSWLVLKRSLLPQTQEAAIDKVT